MRGWVKLRTITVCTAMKKHSSPLPLRVEIVQSAFLTFPAPSVLLHELPYHEKRWKYGNFKSVSSTIVQVHTVQYWIILNVKSQKYSSVRNSLLLKVECQLCNNFFPVGNLRWHILKEHCHNKVTKEEMPGKIQLCGSEKFSLFVVQYLNSALSNIHTTYMCVMTVIFTILFLKI